VNIMLEKASQIEGTQVEAALQKRETGDGREDYIYSGTKMYSQAYNICHTT